MRRITTLVITVIVLSSPTTASAIENTDDGNTLTIDSPALVSGTAWADSHGAYLIATRSQRCWYPQAWYDEVVIFDDESNFVGYNTDSVYHHYITTKIGINGPTGPTAAQTDLFGTHPMWSQRSCIQDAYVAHGDCSTEDRIGVLSSHAVRDAYLGDVTVTGDFDYEDRRGLYCLVVIERDPLYDLARDQSLVPEPIRATFPQFRTLVGLENKVWYETATGNNSTNGGFNIALPTAGIDFALALNIWLTEIRIDTNGDGNWDFIRQCPGTDPDQLESCAGTSDNPAYTFQYQTRAFHPFTIETLWAGQATDLNGIILDINPGMIGNEHTFDWETAEVRSSLDG